MDLVPRSPRCLFAMLQTDNKTKGRCAAEDHNGGAAAAHVAQSKALLPVRMASPQSVVDSEKASATRLPMAYARECRGPFHAVQLWGADRTWPAELLRDQPGAFAVGSRGSARSPPFRAKRAEPHRCICLSSEARSRYGPCIRCREARSRVPALQRCAMESARAW